ncbi:hypothetical protein ABL78_6368 [Leptomonas seymouri]|uniref:Uncharacterized protein n=1 Tax=Leptomonas seymouri TaxID=5684 RepID=A0A0N1I0X2_LEPSE|nr:hypothetical protein ABL78_6368 [Leptomonas seymouri]|eukprot:KPI84578.1 hypothetical protein ABL78_6368 [Leptomonas seymouri]
MTTRAAYSIRSSRSPPISTARCSVDKALHPNPSAHVNGGSLSTTVRSNTSARSQSRSQVLPNEPTPGLPSSAPRRLTSHSRNIPFHSGSPRRVLPPAAPTPQRGTSQPQIPEQQRQPLAPRQRSTSHSAISQQMSPTRVELRAGGVYVESMDAIPTSSVRAHPPLPPTPQQRGKGQDYTSLLPPAPAPVSPAAPLTQHRRRSVEGSRGNGTSTEDLRAYAHAALLRRAKVRRQQQYSPPCNGDQVSENLYGVTCGSPLPQQPQLRSTTPVDYYSLAPSLQLAQHRHVRHIVAGEVSRESPPRRDPYPPARQDSYAVQQTNLEGSASSLSEPGSSLSNRTRQVFRRPQWQSLLTGVLPAGSPYGATPTYAVAMPRRHRVPAGPHPQPTAPYPLQRQQGPQQSSQWRGVEEICVEPTVEEPYFMDEEGSRVVEYVPEPPPPLPSFLHRRQQQQQYAAHSVSPVLHSAPSLPFRGSNPSTRLQLIQPVADYHSSPQRQQQRLHQRDLCSQPSPPEEPHHDSSYSHNDDDSAAATVPAGAQPPECRPPSPSPPMPPQSSSRRSNLKRHQTERPAPPPPPPAPRQQQESQQRPHAPKGFYLERNTSSSSQRQPPPTLPPPPPLRHEDGFRPPRLGVEASAERLDRANTDRTLQGPLYPTLQEPYGGAGSRPSAQKPSEQPQQEKRRAAHTPGQRCRGSPSACRNPREEQRPPHADGQQRPQPLRKQQPSAATAAWCVEDTERRLLSMRAQVAPAHHEPSPSPPAQNPGDRDVAHDADESEEEQVVRETVVRRWAGANQQPAASQSPSIAKDSHDTLSLDLNSTIDPDDILAQQEAKRMAAELVQRAMMPPTPCAAPQLMNGPTPYSDSSEEGDAEMSVGHAKRFTRNTATDAAVLGEGSDTNAGSTSVAVSTVGSAPPPHIVGARTEERAGLNQREMRENKKAAAAWSSDVRDSTVPSIDGTGAIAIAHTSPTGSSSGVPHSDRVAQGRRAVTNEVLGSQGSLVGLQLSALEGRAVNTDVPAPPEQLDTLEKGKGSALDHLQVSHGDAAGEGVDENSHAHEDHHHPTTDGFSDDQARQHFYEGCSAEADPDLPEAEETQKAKADEEESEEEGCSASPPPPLLLLTPSVHPAPVVPPQLHSHALERESSNESYCTEEVGEAQAAVSSLEFGERYGYIDPLEEAAMDAAYMLDTLEDQYVRINEETGEEMEDLVHVVELNRYDCTVEPRYFMPKGQYSEVLPLLRYPTAADRAATAPDANGASPAPHALAYVPLTEAAYLNLCAVIWLSRFHREDTARLLAIAQGPTPPVPAMAGEICYFDHPSAGLLEELDSVVARHVQGTIHEACKQTGESFPTACARLADRNNVAYLPPAVWQQSTRDTECSVTSFADHVTEVLLTATVPQEAARRQATRRSTTSEAERRAQKTWSLFLGALPWNCDEVVEAEFFASMPTAAARLSYAFMFKARMRNIEGGLGSLIFSALSAQVSDAAVLDSLLMQEKLRLALLYSYKNIAACCALRRQAPKRRFGSPPGSRQHGDDDDSASRDGNYNNITEWCSPVFSSYMQLRDGEVSANGGFSLPGEGEDDAVDLYSIAVQLNCFVPIKTERGIHQLCAALIEDMFSIGALVVPEEVRTAEGSVLTDRTSIMDALVVEGSQAMQHIIMTLSDRGYTSAISIDDYVGLNGCVNAEEVRAAMEGYLVPFDPSVMGFLSTAVPVNELFKYARVDGPPSMQAHTLGHKSTFVEVLRMQYIAETIQYAMEMQDAILVASQYNHLVAVHRKRVQQQPKTRPTPRSMAEELLMDSVVVGSSMDLVLNAAPLLPREQEAASSSLLAELASTDTADGHNGRHTEEEEVATLGHNAEEDAKGEEVLLRAVLVALCSADPAKPVSEVQEYLRHLLVLYAEVRDIHNNPVESSDPLQVAHARVEAAELTTVDWFGQTAADGTLLPGAVPARCDETRVNAEELAALCPRVLGRRVGLASAAVADAASTITASALAQAKGAKNNGDYVLLSNSSSRPPLAR